MKSKKIREKRPEQSDNTRPQGQAAPIGGWPSIWNWGSSRRVEGRKREIRDLHGDYSEQTGAFFG